jgi:hypothetical protein
MKTTDDFTPGRRVCWLGYGTSATEHCHGRIARVTKTLIVVTSDVRGAEWRFRKDSLKAVPQDTWGGYNLSLTCQKPKKKG